MTTILISILSGVLGMVIGFAIGVYITIKKMKELNKKRFLGIIINTHAN